MDGRATSDRRSKLEQDRRKWDFWSARERFWRVYERDTRELRGDAVARLDLEPGDTVLDVGCGPGTNFELLREAIGADGRVIGVDLSPGMVERATERIETHGWENVEAVRADATALSLGDERFDGALATTAVSSTPDVPATVENVHDVLEPGARFAVYEIRLVPSGPGRLLNPLIRRFYRAFGNWNDEHNVLAALERSFDDTAVVERVALGTNYVAVATRSDGRSTTE
ncbi:class I SAM-dependent methyltransferase [Halorarum halobium]|uniref:class I SAM-dependent methyltransferase n=1 Tax=Halorarum halobium TaxID=3075121 RepID=UPI0028AFC0EA|nr:methyltransferase domain-containing protein [Halobaculum sp. XH14]